MADQARQRLNRSKDMLVRAPTVIQLITTTDKSHFVILNAIWFCRPSPDTPVMVTLGILVDILVPEERMRATLGFHVLHIVRENAKYAWIDLHPGQPRQQGEHS
ncbi:MAG: hypothetical protein ACT7A5_15275 [Ferrovibrionaceae bacterium]